MTDCRRNPDEIDPTVSVYDGPRQHEEFLLGTFVVNNDTKPQTFSSKRGYQELTVSETDIYYYYYSMKSRRKKAFS